MNRWCFTRDVGFMEDKEGPWVRFEEIKPQLTLEELRDQFEKYYNMGDHCFSRDVDSNGTYLYPDLENQWFAYQSCAKANNILREG